jgi:aspartate racemase
MGPFAGFDLARKICENTDASTDHGHIPLILFSFPSRIPDRSDFLLNSGDSPVPAITSIFNDIVKAGAEVVGISCNTAHSPSILDPVLETIDTNKTQFVHIVAEAQNFISKKLPNIRKIGLLSTTATIKTGIYQHFFHKAGIEIVVPDDKLQATVLATIYDKECGIKSAPGKNKGLSKQTLAGAIHELKNKGAEAILLGCTELPLVLSEQFVHDLPVFDPTEIQARALIRAAAPEKLIQSEFYDTNPK